MSSHLPRAKKLQTTEPCVLMCAWGSIINTPVFQPIPFCCVVDINKICRIGFATLPFFFGFATKFQQVLRPGASTHPGAHSTGRMRAESPKTGTKLLIPFQYDCYNLYIHVLNVHVHVSAGYSGGMELLLTTEHLLMT